MIRNKSDLKEYLIEDEKALFPNGAGWFTKYKDLIYKYQVLLRKCEYYKNTSQNAYFNPLYIFCKYRMRRLGIKLNFSIPENCFGKGNFFLELQDHGIPEQKTVNAGLMRMSQETGIELVATNDVHYTYAEDAEPHDILLCLQTGKKLSDENRMRYEGGQYFVKSEEEMRALFPYAAQAIENTQKIADRCNVEIEFGVTKLPHFEVPEGYDSRT